MTGLSSVTNNPYADLGLGVPEQDKNKKELGQAEFLKLLTTQLQHQDPTAPTDNKEFIAQMAQFSSVDSLQSLESKFDNLSTALTSNQALQASTMVGREVIVPGNASYHAGNGIGGRVNIDGSAANIKVNVLDEFGQLVKTVHVGDKSGDTASFYWDGTDENGNPMPEGRYQVQAFGDVYGQTQQMTTSVVAYVESVNFGKAGQGIMLNLYELGTIPLTDVEEIG